MESITIGLRTRNLGTESRQVPNPFTGKLLTVHIDGKMTDAEVLASSVLLNDVNASEPDPDGYRRIKFGGSSVANLSLHGGAGVVEIEGGLSAEAVDCIFRLATASGMLVSSTISEVVAILPGQEHPLINDRWPDAVHVDTPKELMQWIKSKSASGDIA